jgi:hypothetical protein
MALTDDLISYWKLDEASGNAADAHGSNTLTPVAAPTGATGIINNGRDFEQSSSQFLECADNASLDRGDTDFSFSLWVSLETSTATTQTILSKDGGAGDRQYRLDVSGGSLRWFVFDSGGGVAGQASAAWNPSLGTFHHIVVWHDAAANEVGYVIDDGTPVTAATSAAAGTGGADFEIAGNPNAFDGIIDEVGLWGRVISDAEITSLYNSGAGLAYANFGGSTPFRAMFRGS